jgi:hypothetical protein
MLRPLQGGEVFLPGGQGHGFDGVSGEAGMTGFDMVIETLPARATFRSAIAEALNLTMSEVVLVDAIEPDTAPGAVTVEMTPTKGDFRWLLAFYFKDGMSSPADIEIARRLCSALQTRALISDNSVNPYTMTLVDRDGSVSPVSLDADRLDAEEEYSIKERFEPVK